MDKDCNALSTYDFTLGGYAVWSAMAQYRADPRWTVMVNVNKVFDRVCAGSSERAPQGP